MNERPSLEDVKVGDELIVQTNAKYLPNYPVTVVKVARVWITVALFGGGREEKYRKDNGAQEGHLNFSRTPRLTTSEHLDYEQRMGASREYLRYLGVEAHRMKSDVLTTLELANLIRGYLGLEEL